MATVMTEFEIELMLEPTIRSEHKWFDGFTWHAGKPPTDGVGKFMTPRRRSYGRQLTNKATENPKYINATTVVAYN